eukprot:822206_1
MVVHKTSLTVATHHFSIALCCVDVSNVIYYWCHDGCVPHDIIRLVHSFYGAISKLYTTAYPQYPKHQRWPGHRDTSHSILFCVNKYHWYRIKTFESDVNIMQIEGGCSRCLFLDSNGMIWISEKIWNGMCA